MLFYSVNKSFNRHQQPIHPTTGHTDCVVKAKQILDFCARLTALNVSENASMMQL